MRGLRIGFIGLTGVALSFVASRAVAQQQAAQQPTTVQLPEFHQTSVSTTVSVPDRGAAFLGGMNSAAAGTVNQGVPGMNVRPFSNAGSVRIGIGGSASISARIHDRQAMDAAILGQTAGSAQEALVTAPEVLNSAGGSVADLKARAEAADAARQAQAADELARARQLLAEGKPGVAKIYFQMAAKHASGDVKQHALAELESLKQPKAAVAGK